MFAPLISFIYFTGKTTKLKFMHLFFRALKTRGNTPKYGLIFHSTFIGRAGAKNKGRISRYLANKCSIASRIDCFSGLSSWVSTSQCSLILLCAFLCKIDLICWTYVQQLCFCCFFSQNFSKLSMCNFGTL